MNRKNQIKRRIAKRKNIQYKTPACYHLVYRSVMLGMIIIVAALGCGIAEKQGLVKGEQLLSIGTWFPYEKWFSLQDETVSSHTSYALLKNDLYANGSNEAFAILDGVVMDVQKKEKGYEITIKQDNGVETLYGLLQSTAIQKGERIQKGDTLGTFESNVFLHFEKDGKKLSLKQAME